MMMFDATQVRRQPTLKADCLLWLYHSKRSGSASHVRPGNQLRVREAWRASLDFELTKPRNILSKSLLIYTTDRKSNLLAFTPGKVGLKCSCSAEPAASC